MALKMNVQLDNGVFLKNSYMKITTVGGSKENCTIELSYYVDETFTNEKYVHKKYFNFIPDVSDSAGNFLKQGYEHLKTLDEFKEAIDILEVEQ